MRTTTAGCIVRGMNTSGKRIASAREIKGWNQSELARMLGVKPQSVQAWESGKNTPRPPRMKQLSQLLGRPVGYLMGEDVGADGSSAAGGDSGSASGARHIRITDRPGFIEIPQLDVRVSMGSGAIRPDTVDVIQRMTVSMEFLRQSVTFSNATNLALITGYGDSMEGTFNDGDLLLVDRGVNEVKIDAVYVLSLNDELYIKRLQRRGDGTFSMISDNRRYDPIQITGKDLERFQVLGRVLLAWNARKL